MFLGSPSHILRDTTQRHDKNTSAGGARKNPISLHHPSTPPLKTKNQTTIIPQRAGQHLARGADVINNQPLRQCVLTANVASSKLPTKNHRPPPDKIQRGSVAAN